MLRSSRVLISRLNQLPRQKCLIQAPPFLLLESRQVSTCQILYRFSNEKHFMLTKPSLDAELPSIKKRILETDSLQNAEEISKFWEESRIKIVKSTCQKVPDPIFDFSLCGLPEKTIQRLLQNGIEKPMPIQAQGIPIAMAGHDMIAIGETGSGKTLGFLIPAIQHTLSQERADFR